MENVFQVDHNPKAKQIPVEQFRQNVNLINLHLKNLSKQFCVDFLDFYMIPGKLFNLMNTDSVDVAVVA